MDHDHNRPSLENIFMIVRVGDGVKRIYHPACYLKVRNAQLELPDGDVGRIHSEVTCGHCRLCGGQLWAATVDCRRHDGPCPTVDWLVTSTFEDFRIVWVHHGWPFDDDVIDAGSMIMREPNAPTELDDLIARTRYILDRTT